VGQTFLSAAAFPRAVQAKINGAKNSGR